MWFWVFAIWLGVPAIMGIPDQVRFYRAPSFQSWRKMHHLSPRQWLFLAVWCGGPPLAFILGECRL